MKKTISLVLILSLGLATEVAMADFIFGTPTNLGPVGIGFDDLVLSHHEPPLGPAVLCCSSL